MNKTIRWILMALLLVMIWSRNGITEESDTNYEDVDANEIPGVLSMLASATQANYDRIDTWECTIQKETITTTRGSQAIQLLRKYTDAEPNDLVNEIERISERTIEFKINVRNDLLFSISNSTEPYIYLEPKKGNTYTANWRPEELIFIATPNHLLEISPFRKTKDGRILNRVGRKVRPRSVRISDPRTVYYIGEKTLWLSLSQVSQALQTPDIDKFGVVVKRKSSSGNVTYRIELSEPHTTRPFCILVCASDVAFNRTYIENWLDDGSLMSKSTTEFVNLQGVFLPSNWEVSQYFPDGGLQLMETYTVEHQQINTPISDSTFSEHTYLKDGDRLNDELTRKKYAYRDKQLVEIEERPGQRSPRE